MTEYKAYSVYENYVKAVNYKHSAYSVLPFLVFSHVVTCLLDRFVSAWLCCHSLDDSNELLPSSVTVKKLNMRLIYLILLRIAHVLNDKYYLSLLNVNIRVEVCLHPTSLIKWPKFSVGGLRRIQSMYITLTSVSIYYFQSATAYFCGYMSATHSWSSYLNNNGRGELSYLAPLGSENISAPYFRQCFFQGGGVLPPRLSQTPRLPVPRQK